MKKLIASLLPCAALALASCGDSNYELHQTFFSPLKINGMDFFADQQSDTIHLLSLDSWTLASTASVSRDLHCFEMSCSVVLRPYSSFNFTFRARANELADALKWDKRSSYSSNIEWY